MSSENPKHSHYWAAVRELLTTFPEASLWWEALEDNCFQSCQYGSDTNKWTCFRGTPHVFLSLRQVCDGTHTHKSWTPETVNGKPIFPTAAEAAYPKPLCDAYATDLVRALRSKGVRFLPTQLESVREPRYLRQFGRKQVPPWWLSIGLLLLVNELNSFHTPNFCRHQSCVRKWGRKGNSSRVTLTKQHAPSRQCTGWRVRHHRSKGGVF